MSKDLILDKAKELAHLIAETEEVKVFKQAEQKIKENASIQALISELRRKQKELVSYEHLKKDKIVKVIEEEMESIQQQIDDFPIVQDFKDTQIEINDLLQTITGIITSEVTKYITGSSPQEEQEHLTQDGSSCLIPRE